MACNLPRKAKISGEFEVTGIAATLRVLRAVQNCGAGRPNFAALGR